MEGILASNADRVAVRSVAEIATLLAGRYLTQLCKHFEHKCLVSYDAHSGSIGFVAGECRLLAEAGVLTLACEAADAALLEQVQDVVARHLLRFAFREEMRIEWRAV